MQIAAYRRGYPHRKIIKQHRNNASPVFVEIVFQFFRHSHFGWWPYEDRLGRLSGSICPIERKNNLGCMQIGWGHFPSTAHLPGHGVYAGNFSAVCNLGGGRASKLPVLAFPKTAAGNFRHMHFGW